MKMLAPLFIRINWDLCIILFFTMTCLTLSLGACDFNVELTDEKRILQAIEGNSICSREQRVSIGRQGSHKLRLFLVDNEKEAINLAGIDEPPFNLTAKDFSVAQSSVKVLDAITGQQIAGATAEIKINPQQTITVEANPRYDEFSLGTSSIGNRRVPNSVMLLVDMSQSARNQDSSRSRTAAAGLWVYDYFNQDLSLGELDILASFLVRNNNIQSDDNLFKSEAREKQYIRQEDNRTRGFLYTDEENKNLISKTFTNITSSESGGKPPVYDAIEAAASALRVISREDSVPIFNPAIIAITLERDINLLDRKDTNALNQAQSAIRGQSTKDVQYDFIPFNAISYRSYEDTATQEEWELYLDDLCNLAQSGGVNTRTYWGNVFQIRPEPTRRLETIIRSRLSMASHSMKGYIELSVDYTLKGTGIEQGKRYLISFSMLGKLLGVEIKEGQSFNQPEIYFEVQIQ